MPCKPDGDTLFTTGAVASFAAGSVFAAWIDPVLLYDCARQASGSVGCTVHRRMYGVIPLGDVRNSVSARGGGAFGLSAR
jgi:hypothetical protein